MIPVCDFGVRFLANDFKSDDEPRHGAYPVVVLFCEACSLAQTSAVVSPEVLYDYYSYTTSKSQTMRNHFASLWGEIQHECQARTVLEIGSNTGDLLEYCRDHGAEFVAGVEPSRNLSDISRSKGICTFTEAYGKNGVYYSVARDVIIARHVFCHVNDWVGFVASLEADSGPNTVAVIEVPYVLDTLRECQLDQLYLEHTSYLSLHAMSALLKDSAFHIHKVTRYEIHGGAIAIFLRRNDSGIAPHESAARMLAEERITINDWREFTSNACRKIHDLKTSIGCFFARKVCAFGASAKSSVWIQACGFTKDDIAFICDNTPQKQGCLSPGTDIPIVPESHLTRENADVCINFAWNFHREISEKLKPWIEAGGTLVNPHEL